MLRVTLTADQKYRIWTPLKEISPALIDATLRFEDKYYGQHPGVNPVSLVPRDLELRPLPAGPARALRPSRCNWRGCAIICTPARVAGKLRQIVYALELERHYSKAQILEAYLNLAPYGRNIEGVGAASEIYFAKTAARVSRPEAVALSVIPQSPTRRALIAGRRKRAAHRGATALVLAHGRNRRRPR